MPLLLPRRITLLLIQPFKIYGPPSLGSFLPADKLVNCVPSRRMTYISSLPLPSCTRKASQSPFGDQSGGSIKLNSASESHVCFCGSNRNKPALFPSSLMGYENAARSPFGDQISDVKLKFKPNGVEISSASGHGLVPIAHDPGTRTNLDFSFP